MHINKRHLLAILQVLTSNHLRSLGHVGRLVLDHSHSGQDVDLVQAGHLLDVMHDIFLEARHTVGPFTLEAESAGHILRWGHTSADEATAGHQDQAEEHD